MAKITNTHLSDKLDLIRDDFKEIKDDVKQNTAFRNQARGMVATVTLVASLIGGGIVWIGNKLFFLSK